MSTGTGLRLAGANLRQLRPLISCEVVSAETQTARTVNSNYHFNKVSRQTHLVADTQAPTLVSAFVLQTKLGVELSETAFIRLGIHFGFVK